MPPPGGGGYGPPPGGGGYGPPPGQNPPPGYGAPQGYGAGQAQLATWGERVVAYLIEYAIGLGFLIVGLILAGILGAIVDVLGVLLGLVVYAGTIGFSFYNMYLNGATGQSVGKRLTGLKVVGEQTGQPIGGGMGIVRGLAHIVDGLVCYIGFLLPLFDDKKQTIADKLVSTLVISGGPKQSFGPDVFKP
jgi:uncharacterized RDD family membrane protein YckC